MLLSSKLCEDNIWENDVITTAFVTGFLRPKIYIPANLPGEQRKYVVMHEKLHINRKDHIFKLFAFAALCLHWFNPLVWLSFRLFEEDMEMSCDEGVIKNMEKADKIAYSVTLLNISSHNYLGAPEVAFGEGNTKNRIVNVLGFKKPSVLCSVCISAAIIALSAALVFNPVGESTPEPVQPEQTVQAAQATQTVKKLIYPTEPETHISRGFAEDIHNGIDIAGPAGSDIYSAADGVVIEAEYNSTDEGIYCIVDHGDFRAMYSHCSELTVEAGQTVKQGQVIAKMGSTGNSTGNHLHFEVTVDGTPCNPLDLF